MIYEGSRYATGELYYDEDLKIPYIAPQTTEYENNKDDLFYLFRVEDRLDLLANRFYYNPQMKWLILQANPQYLSEHDIKIGDIIRIPNLEDVN